MKYLGILVTIMFLFMGPFALGIKLSAKLVDERAKLELPYRIAKYAAIVAFVLFLLVNIYYNYHRVE